MKTGLATKRRDLDPLRLATWAHGTKSKARDRIVHVAEWAWPYVERDAVLLLPNAPLFERITRWTASDVHRAACQRLEIEDYRLHDARHTFAVRAIRAGASFEFVAQQLGHVNTTMVVRVYGRYKPTEEESRSWERIAALQDEDHANTLPTATPNLSPTR